MVQDETAVTGFQLDDRLQKDCAVLLEQDGVSFLLHRNAEVKWFILVPHTDLIEFYQLDRSLQLKLIDQMNLLSAFIQQSWAVDKINVATIGNVVSQMHIHVIGRSINDAYWPDVVWGKPCEKLYENQQIAQIQQQLDAFIQKK